MMTRQLSRVIQNILFMEGEWPTRAPLSQPEFEKYSDAQLLAILQGNGGRGQKEDAFSAIYNKYYLDIVKINRSKGVNEDGVRDIFADVWMVFFNKISTFEWDETTKAGKDKSFKPFLLKTNLNLRNAYFRKKSATSDISLDQVVDYIDNRLKIAPPSPTYANSPEIQEKSDAMFEHYLSLLKSDRDREILRQFYYFENRNSAEIAEILRMKSAGAVRTALSRALKKLRKAIQKANNND